VDLFHAREHVHDLANLAGRLLAGYHDEWLAQRIAELDAGDVPAILAADRDLKFRGSLAGERDKALHYFEVNAHRMRYAWHRSLGLFTGSGVVEAGCRSMIGQRLKLSGMRWTQNGATGILTLRCQEASNRWEQKPGSPPASPAQPEPPDLKQCLTQTFQASETYSSVTCEVGPGRGSGVTTGPFLWAPSRTRRVPLGTSGSPRALPVGQLPVVAAAGTGVHGVGILLPR
jgi:hypothetical protein